MKPLTLLADSVWTARYFSPDDGLVYQVVRDVAQMPKGEIWFATWGGGLSLYDGLNWKTFNTEDGLVNNFTRTLATDSKGGLWVGTNSGISYFDGEEWTNYTIDNTSVLSIDSVYSILVRQNGEVWFGMNKGYLYAYDPSNNSWRSIDNPCLLNHSNIRTLFESYDGRVWINEDALFSYNGRIWENHQAIPRIQRLSIFKNKKIIALGDKSYYEEGDVPIRIYHYPYSDLTTGLIETSSGELFIGTKNGVQHYQNGVWSLFRMHDENIHPAVETIRSFDDHSVWIGTRNGIFLIRRSDWMRFSFPSTEFNYNNFYPGRENEPSLLLNHGTIVTFNNGEWKTTGQVHLNQASDHVIVSWDQNEMILQDLHTIYTYQLPSFSLIRRIDKPEEFHNYATWIASTGTMYMYGNQGIIYWNDNEWIPFDEPGADVAATEINLFKETTDGSRWIVANDVGLYRNIKGEEWEQLSLPGIEGRRIIDIYTARDGSSWFATSGNGILVEKDGVVQNFNSRNGLHNDWVTCLYEAGDGTIWAGMEDSTAASYRDGRWIMFNFKETRLTGKIQRICENPRGTIWLITNKGEAARYTPSLDAPDTFIQDYTAELTPRGIGVFSFTGQDVWHNTLTEHLVFSWRVLDRVSGDVVFPWSPFVMKNTIATPPLSAGRYLFEVKAADKERNVDLSPAFVPFTVEQFFFLKPVFWTPVVLSFIIALALLMAWRRKHYALLENERWLSQAQQIAHLGHWITDIQHNRLRGSNEFEKIVGFSNKTLVDAYKTYIRMTQSHDRRFVLDSFRNLPKEKTIREFEHEIVLPKGVKKVIHVRYEVEYNEAGTAMRVMGTLQDVTKTRRLEEEARKKQKLEAIGILAAGIAHDFNNLLMVILGNISLVKASVNTQSRLYEQLELAEQTSIKAHELTKRLTAFSKGSAPNMNSRLLQPIVRKAVSFLITTNPDLHVHVDESGTVQPVLIDEEQIMQVVQNVLFNATDAMPNGGNIYIQFENISIKHDSILTDGEYLKTTVRDEGFGIPSEILQKIFDPYFTTKKNVTQKGLGLGLAICFSIMKQHKGKIEFDSKSGIGTTVSLYLPICSAN